MQRKSLVISLILLSICLGGASCEEVEDLLSGQLLVDDGVINSSVDARGCQNNVPIFNEAYGVTISCDHRGGVHVTNTEPGGGLAMWEACDKFNYLLQGNAGQVEIWERACGDL